MANIETETPDGGGEWGGDIPLPSRLGGFWSVVSSPCIGAWGSAKNDFRPTPF